MLDSDLLKNASVSSADRHAQSMPLLIGEVTELLEGPLLKLTHQCQLKLWLPISYSSLGDDEWVNGLVEQFSAPNTPAAGLALILRWNDLPPLLIGLRRNVRRLRRVGLRALDTAHAPIALAYQPNSDISAETEESGSIEVLRRGLHAASIDDVMFGAPISFADVVRQLREKS